MTDNRPALAAALDLEPHPEGGWYRQTWRSPVEFSPKEYDGPRASATAIYFLLMPGERSVPHTVRSDELWLWHRGGPLVLTIGGEEIILGPDVEGGQVPQAVVPGGISQAPNLPMPSTCWSAASSRPDSTVRTSGWSDPVRGYGTSSTPSSTAQLMVRSRCGQESGWPGPAPSA